MSQSWMDRDRFLREYELELEKEFESGGEAAHWAPGVSGPRLWGTEDATMTLKDDDPIKANTPSASAALSPDERFMAIATNAVIRIYDVSSKQMHAELVGHLSNVWTLHFAPERKERSTTSRTSGHVEHGKHEEYVLFSEGAEVGGGDGQVICWSLDAEGRQLGRAMPFAIEGMADKAIAAISTDLDEHHSLGDEAMGSIRAGFVETLGVADVNNRAKHLSVREGHFPGFGTFPASHDGQSLLYIAHGESTQSGMRPPEELPQIVVVDTATQTERCRLKGHTDAIMWAGWSADDKTIVTACWDEYYKIWDASTGECRHSIGPTDGQNWAGAFSPDGKQVLLSGGRPVKVATYDLETGMEIAKLESEGLKLDSWMRYNSWSRNGDSIALVNGQSVVLWEPFKNTAETIFQLKSDGTMLTRYNKISCIEWVDGGKKLLLRDGDQTIFVWDKGTNKKWRFQRHRGTELHSRSDMLYSASTQTVISLDGDSKVRFWKL